MSATLPTTPENPNTSPEKTPHYLMWFRRDLRLADNTALAALCERAHTDNARVSAVFFYTPEQWHIHDMSLTQADLIARTLPILAEHLDKQFNITLQVYVCPLFSDCIAAMIELCATQNISLMMANHDYEGREIARDEQLSMQLANSHIEFVRWHDQCILPPKSITTTDGSMYQVFTPFYNKWRHTLEVSTLQPHHAMRIKANNKTNLSASKLTCSSASAHSPDSIAALGVETIQAYQQRLQDNPLMTHIDRQAQLTHARGAYPAGETAACHRLDQFIAEDIVSYDVSRDVPSLQATSQLSAYLAMGSISARHCYLQAVKALQGNDSDNNAINRWISELAWRDFYRHVLVDKPALIRHQAYKDDTDKRISWSYHQADFETWCQGMTGVPLVDAAMRCLNATGVMHNRLRMVTAMFLTKDLLIDWRLGERYFMQQLIDGDFASNNGGWQWSASTGTDAAPYFRIMNPFSQGKSHDPEGIFIKTWLPELKDIPATVLHSEDKMRKALKKGGDFASVHYPQPMVEHKAARLRAIAEFKKQ